MASERFQQLEEQLRVLARCLLPAKFDPTGTYDDQDVVSMRALAYRVLAHAEIESYFEDRALEPVSRAQTVWESTRHVSHVALCLLGFSGKEMALPPATLEAPSDNKRKAWPALVDIGQRLLPIISTFHNQVRNENHGVKEKNLLAMLLPIGVAHAKIDPTFLADMESFGALRGQAAHASGRTTARQAVDPEGEQKRVLGLLPGIAAIDAEIDVLLAAMPVPPVSAPTAVAAVAAPA
jgi:hypothetical protein